jgi:hypothetical protein
MRAAGCGALRTFEDCTCRRSDVGAAAAGQPPVGPTACPRCARVPCDARTRVALRNSLRSLRSLRSNTRCESEDEARCACRLVFCASRLRQRAAGRLPHTGWAAVVVFAQARHRQWRWAVVVPAGAGPCSRFAGRLQSERGVDEATAAHRSRSPAVGPENAGTAGDQLQPRWHASGTTTNDRKAPRADARFARPRHQRVRDSSSKSSP